MEPTNAKRAEPLQPQLFSRQPRRNEASSRRSQSAFPCLPVSLLLFVPLLFGPLMAYCVPAQVTDFESTVYSLCSKVYPVAFFFALSRR